MPNYTWTTIESDKNTIASLLNSNGEFTFNTFIEMPEEFKRTISGGRIGSCICYYLLKTLSWNDASTEIKKLPIMNDYNYCKKKTKSETLAKLKEVIGNNPMMFNDEMYYENNIVVKENYGHTPEEIGEYYYNLYKKYGFCNWYDWSNANWGTKWDAFDIYTDKTCISFTTAWSAPEPILARISQNHPKAKIKFCCEYEDGYYMEASNHNGHFVIDSEWEKEYDDDDDYEGTWVNTTTGERKDA